MTLVLLIVCSWLLSYIASPIYNCLLLSLDVLFQIIENEGDGYSPITGVFRAPVAGIYQFSISILSQLKAKYAHIQLMKGETELGILFAGDNVAQNGQMGTITVNTRLAKGDEVFARELAGNTGYVHGGSFSSFTGVLLDM